MPINNTFVFRLAITAAVVGWGGYLVLSGAAPNPDYLSLPDEVRTVGTADMVKKWTKLYGYEVARFDGEAWVIGDAPLVSGQNDYARRVLETPMCHEEDCVAYLAQKVQKTSMPVMAPTHYFTLVWSEADGRVLEVAEYNRLWQW